MYGEDLAWIHDVGFTEFARNSAGGIIRLLHEHGLNSGHIVDLGCGSGVWPKRLVEEGFDVTGIDISPAMIELSRKRVPSATFHVASYLDFEFPSCIAVTALGEVFSYTFDERNGESALGELFQRVFSALEPGGLFIFDLAKPNRHVNDTQKFVEGEGWTVLVEFMHDAKSRQLTRRIVTFCRDGDSWRRGEELHRVQLYEADDIRQLLCNTGFSVEVFGRYGDFELPDLAAFIASKPTEI